MDFETLGLIAAVWIVISIVVSPVLGRLLHESDVGAIAEDKLAQTK